jgi:hypothetical protein
MPRLTDTDPNKTFQTIYEAFIWWALIQALVCVFSLAMALGQENYIDAFQQLGGYGPHKSTSIAIGEILLASVIGLILTETKSGLCSLLLHHSNNPR